jgi:hypothetical protein
VFSGGAAFHLEATLDQARLRLVIMTARMPTASRPALRAVGDRMVALEQSLPRARVAAWRSLEVASLAERELAQQVATLAGDLDALTHDPTLAEGAKVLRGLRRRLLDHLPPRTGRSHAACVNWTGLSLRREKPRRRRG